MGKIEFIKPAPGYAYFAGNKTELSDERADKLIKEGYCRKLTDEQEQEQSDLPPSLPGRALLIKEGFTTIAKVLAAGAALSDVKGMTKQMVENVLATLKPKE
jgi:hypothetical protein